MRNRLRNGAIILIVAAGALLRSRDLLRPWVGVHNGWAGAVYGNIARNFVKYGYWATELGPVSSSGRVAQEQFEYYYHYPPLLVWLVSASFQVFGVHEWSARLVPWVFSVALMALIYFFARRFYTERVALLALIFSAIVPIEAYYGAHVDVYGTIVVFFTTLALYGYARWLESSRTRDLALCLAGVVLGCMTAWYTFFLVPLIIVHHRWVNAHRDKSRDRQVWLTAGSALVVFGLFLLHRRLLMGSGRTEVYGTLLQKLLLRVSIQTPSGAKPGFIGLLTSQARDFAHLYSVPLVLLTGAWMGFFVKDALAKRLQAHDWFLLMLLGYGFLHNAAFPSFLLGHDFMIVCYMPGIAIAAAVACARLAVPIERRWGATASAVAVAALLIVSTVAALRATTRLYSEDSDYPASLKRWGEIIRLNSHETDLVFACSPEDRILEWYADRDMRFSISTPREFSDSTARRPAALFVCPERLAEKQRVFLDYLAGAYPRHDKDGLVLFVLRK